MLESALAQTEKDVQQALSAAQGVLSQLKKLRAAAHEGDLRELRKTMENASQSLQLLNQQFANSKDGWAFDEETYFSGRDYLAELTAAAAAEGITMYEQDERLYCYPFLIRLLGKDRSVLIDKKRERRLRPAVLVARLKEWQKKPSRFKAESFLEVLYNAYRIAVRSRERSLLGAGAVVPLTELYDLLTLLPGQSKEYPRPEFARDIYLLDKSGVTTTKKGAVVSFPASRATNTLTVITEEGREKKYYGLSFSGEQEAESK